MIDVAARKKILVVDDSETSLMVSRMVLSRGGYQLVTAKTGEEGLSKAFSDRPDLILLDVVMPGIDGFEACRRIRANPATATIPVILVTSRGEQGSFETGYSSGCTDYVTKPVDGVELITKVRSCLGA